MKKFFQTLAINGKCQLYGLLTLCSPYCRYATYSKVNISYKVSFKTRFYLFFLFLITLVNTN